MLIRDVQFGDKVYSRHELTQLTVIVEDGNVVDDILTACVRSETFDGSESLETYHNLSYQDGFSVAIAEERLWLLPEFEEYVDQTQAALDEVLDILTDEQAVTVPDAFPQWMSGTGYSVGDRRRYEGILYKCLQAHTSQEDYTPDVAASLWARMLNPDPEVIPVWEQPDSTNPYMTGDKVHYPDANGPVYESLIDNNVFSPEAYPQGWQLVQ